MKGSLESRLIAETKAWKTGLKGRPLKELKTRELRSPDIYEKIRKTRKLKTCGEALMMVGAELRQRFQEMG